MAAIRIHQPHALTIDRARAAAQAMAERMASEFGANYEWEGDMLRFRQTGAQGTLALLDGEARLELELGGMMSAFASMIEEKLGRKMREIFTA